MMNSALKNDDFCIKNDGFRKDIGAAVSRLVHLHLYAQAHQVLTQYERRGTPPEQASSQAAEMKRLKRLHETVDKKELLFWVSQHNGMHEALPLLSRSGPLEVLQLCNSVLGFISGPEVSNCSIQNHGFFI